MRCREIRSQLNDSHWTDREISEEVRKHLSECPECANAVRAERELRRLFEGQVTAIEEGTDFTAFRRSIEESVRGHATEANLKSKLQGLNLMSRITQAMKHRPRLGLGIAVVSIFLLASIAIPISYDQVVGYEVALAVEQPDVSINRDKLQLLVDELGLSSAEIKVNCDTSCVIHVVDLESEEDAHLLADAIEKLTMGAVGGEVDQLVELRSGNLIKRLALAIHGHNISINQLDDESGFLAKVGQLHDSLFSDLVVFKKVIVINGDTVVYEHSGDEDGDFEWEGLSDLEGLILESQDGSDSIQLFIVKETVDVIDSGEANMSNGHGSPGENSGTVEFEAATGKSVLPSGFSLSQNYPNPFNPTTTIDFELPRAEHVKLDIYNIKGQRVSTLVDDMLPAGTHSIEWNATADGGTQLPSGIYLYRLSAGDKVVSRKMTLLK